MSNLVYAYDRLHGDLKVRLHGLALDGEESHTTLVQDDEHQVWLTQAIAGPWTTAELSVEVTPEADEIAAIEADGTTPELAAVQFCGRTNVRRIAPLERGVDTPAWRGRVSLNRDELDGKVELRVLVLGGEDGADHRILAEDARWRIYVDEADAPPPSGSLPVEWVKFDAANAPANLPPWATSEAFFVDVQAVPLPKVFLNSAFPGLTRLLTDHRPPPGAVRALRELTFKAIASATWTAMFQAATASMIEEDGEIIPPSVTWQRDALAQLTARMYPDVQDAERLAHLHGQLETPEGAQATASLLAAAIEAQLGVSTTLKNSITSVLKEPSE